MQQRRMNMLDISIQQQHLVDAIWSTNNHTFDAKSLSIYRGNLKANANRSLSITYPTIKALVGETCFSALVEKFIELHPLALGDWGLWGQAFPAWLTQQPSLSTYPYLMDCAALDWQCHLVERAANHDPTPLTIALTQDNLDKVRLQFAVGTQMIHSNYPIVDIWQAHQTNDPALKVELLALSRQKLTAKQGQIALLWRPKWKAMVRQTEQLESDWLAIALANHNLADSLQLLNNNDFSLIGWLPTAFTEGLVCGYLN